MPGIPLLNIGTALGGLAGGWNQAQSQGLQQAIQRLALQQQQGLTNQQTLAGLALQAGLLNQPGGGQTPLQAATGAVPNQSSTPTPGGGVTAPPSYNYSPPVPGGAQPGYAPPLPGAPPAPGDSSQDTPSDAGDLSPAGQVMHNPKVLASWQDASGASSGSGYVLPGGPVQPSSQTASSGGSDATPAPIPTPTPTPTPSSAQSNDSGQSGGVGIQLPNGQVIDMSTMFQHVDYQKLAQGIARLAPPGTSQADIYGAVLDLNKLAEGDRVQQQQAGLLLRALTNGQFSLARTAMTTGTQRDIAAGKSQTAQTIAAGHDATRIQTTEMNNATKTAIANQANATRQAGTQARSAVQWAQVAQRAQQMAQQLNIAGQREAAQAISQQLSALRAQISTIKPGPDGNYGDDDVKRLRAINDQIASIGAKVAAQQGAGP